MALHCNWHKSTIHCRRICVRTFAQLVLHQLLEDFPEAMPEVANQMPSPWRECLKFFRTNPDMQRLEKSLAPALRSYTPHQAITPAGVFYSVRTSHIPLEHTRIMYNAIHTACYTLFCDVSAAAFSLVRCLPGSLCVKILSKQECPASCHSWLPTLCLAHTLCYRGANWQAAVRRRWGLRGLPSPCLTVSLHSSTLSGLLSGKRPLAWQAASQQVPPHSRFAYRLWFVGLIPSCCCEQAGDMDTYVHSIMLL